jgi:signal transduction histidine kinase
MIVKSSNKSSESDQALLEATLRRLKEIVVSLSQKLDLNHSIDHQRIQGPVDVARIVHEIVSEKQVLLLKNIGLEFEVHDDLKPMLIKMDQATIQRILSNLIDNAIESVSSKAIGKVLVSIVTENPELLSIKIQDNGPGFDQAVIDRLGQQGNTLGKVNGNGIGLSFAFTAIRKIGGELIVESIPNLRTTVTLKFPITKVADLNG